MAIGRLCGILAFFYAGASAQWLNYPTPGVPRTADGKPDRSAPAPRTADGKPDLSGIWEDDTGKPPQSCPAGDCEESSDTLKGGFRLAGNVGWVDFGARLPGGLPYQPWAAEAVKRRKVDYGKDDPPTHCMPLGAPRMLVDPLYRKFVQTPGLLVILNERDAAYRQIFNDGRPLPQDPQPSWTGYSTGKWEGDTLVVRTNGLRDGMWLDRIGSPMTDAAKLTERFRRVNYGTMEVEVTVDDPKAYTKPWTVKVIEYIILDTELLDSICSENEKDAIHLVGK
jgi:hypothetical protein